MVKLIVLPKELCQVITEQSGEYLVMSSRESSLPTSRSGLITRTHPGRLPVCRIAVLVLDKEKWCKRWGLPYSAATDVYSVVHEGVEYLLCFKSQKEDKLIRGILVETMFLREHTKKIRKLGWEIKEIGDEITLDDGSFDRTPWTKFSFISTLSATSHQD
jgi:hypothetical protein